MTDEKIRQRLLALATAEDRKIFTRIRDLFPEIEAAITAGVKRAQIVQALNEEGIPISPEVFTSYVSRLRRAQAIEADRSARQPTSRAPSPAGPALSAPSAQPARSSTTQKQPKPQRPQKPTQPIKRERVS